MRIVVFFFSACLCLAQDWQSLAQLHAGDRVRLTLKARTVSDTFSHFTPEEVFVGSLTVKREDVLKLEHYRHSWSRGKTAAAGAAIGGGAGVALGAAVGGCGKGGLGPCITRGETGAIAGAAGAVIGGLIGALLRHHRTDLVYAAK